MRRVVFGLWTIRCAARLGLLILAVAVVGCGPNQVKVSGRVLFDGKPLPGGRVTFRPADPSQNSVSAVIDEQGNYAAVLPAGDVQVSVDNSELEPRSSGPRRGRRGAGSSDVERGRSIPCRSRSRR